MILFGYSVKAITKLAINCRGRIAHGNVCTVSIMGTLVIGQKNDSQTHGYASPVEKKLLAVKILSVLHNPWWPVVSVL